MLEEGSSIAAAQRSRVDIFPVVVFIVRNMPSTETDRVTISCARISTIKDAPRFRLVTRKA